MADGTARRRALAPLVVTLACAGRALAADDLPPVTAEARAAAFPPVSAADLHAHMHDDPFLWMFRAEELEWQGRDGGDALKWDVTAWAGHDMNRVWLRDEGEHVDGAQADNELELLWGRPVAAWWDVLLGLRHDTGPGPARTYAAFGFQGLAPQWFHVEATGYAGERGQVGLALQSDYEWLVTNRLYVTARAEAEAWGSDDRENGIGSGLSTLRGGVRLRYEITRKFAPYAGVEWEGLFGDTADLARASGGPRRDGRLVAGLRFWF